jgi:hypothetical protein
VNRTATILVGTYLLSALLSCQTSSIHGEEKAKAGDQAWNDKFDVPRENFVSTGSNRYFSIEPGFQQVYDGEEDGKAVHLVITVLNETLKVDGVETRIIEERESADGMIVEVSRNYFALDKKTNDIYYFGEDVDNFKNGKLSNHGGSWHSGEKGAHFGLMMPGTPIVGMKHYQEIAPGEAMDRAEILSITATTKTPAGEFTDCLKVEETSSLEPHSKEIKVYAPKAGLLIDGDLKLVKFGMVPK